MKCYESKPIYLQNNNDCIKEFQNKKGNFSSEAFNNFFLQRNY